MAGTQPGTLCQIANPLLIDDETMCRTPTPPPGHLGTEFDESIDLSYIFNSCLSPVRGLTDADYEAAARKLNVEKEVIQAIAAQETPRGAFDSDGRPTILYEPHQFSRLTEHEYDKSAPEVSSATPTAPGGYGKYSAQYGKLEKAYDLASEEALEATSWGRFQIMGENFREAGYTSVEAMVRAMSQSEAAHLQAFSNFVLSDGSLLTAMRNRNWAVIARIYNGPNYAENQYDKKLEEFYDQLKKKAPPTPAPPAPRTLP